MPKEQETLRIRIITMPILLLILRCKNKKLLNKNRRDLYEISIEFAQRSLNTKIQNYIMQQKKSRLPKLYPIQKNATTNKKSFMRRTKFVAYYFALVFPPIIYI